MTLSFGTFCNFGSCLHRSAISSLKLTAIGLGCSFWSDSASFVKGRSVLILLSSSSVCPRSRSENNRKQNNSVLQALSISQGKQFSDHCNNRSLLDANGWFRTGRVSSSNHGGQMSLSIPDKVFHEETGNTDGMWLYIEVTCQSWFTIFLDLYTSRLVVLMKESSL